MNRRPRKNDRLVYTGPYATVEEQRALGMPDPRPIAPYPPGTVMAFREHGRKVTVRLDPPYLDPDVTEYADWPVDQVDFAQQAGGSAHDVITP